MKRRNFLKVCAVLPVAKVLAEDKDADTLEGLCEEFGLSLVKIHRYGDMKWAEVGKEDIHRPITLELDGKPMPLRGQFVIESTYIDDIITHWPN